MEGRSAAAYWGLIGTLPPANFRFKARSKHPAYDLFNAMLNYAYGVLYSEVERACIVAGLDPFVGFLHTDNYNKQSLVYDISEDKQRTKISKACQAYGLQRIQKSVFLGDLPAHSAAEIAEFSRELIDKETDAVFILPCCQEDFGKRIVIGRKEFDEELVQGTKKTMML